MLSVAAVGQIESLDRAHASIRTEDRALGQFYRAVQAQFNLPEHDTVREVPEVLDDVFKAGWQVKWAAAHMGTGELLRGVSLTLAHPNGAKAQLDISADIYPSRDSGVGLRHENPRSLESDLLAVASRVPSLKQHLWRVNISE